MICNAAAGSVDRVTVASRARQQLRARPGTLMGQYRRFAARPVAHGLRELIDARIAQPGAGIDLIDELVESAPERMLQWMKRKADLADGSLLLLPVAGTSAVMAAIDAN